jgi:hypothetical protein
MDGKQFDAIAQNLYEGATRRRAIRLLTAGALGGVAGRLGLTESIEAKRKRKKRHKRGDRCYGDLPKRCSPTAGRPGACYPAGYHCCGATLGGGACPPGEDCCPPNQLYPNGYCAGADEVCCPVEKGGGSCPTEFPVCCGPDPTAPVGSCIPQGFKCCSFGGYCYANETCCAPSPGFPQGVCAAPGVMCPRAGAADAQSEQHFVPIRRAEAKPRIERGRTGVAKDEG